jgi:DNA-binding transcriptional regulator GbsR (MarR family)
MQPGTASLYAFLLLCPEPVTLDRIAATLGMAKSSASVAALEQFGLARRQREPGSKRIRYGASNCYSGFLMAQARLLEDIGRLAEARAGTVALGETLQRLRYLGSFYRKMATSITSRVAELSDEFLRDGPDEELR